MLSHQQIDIPMCQLHKLPAADGVPKATFPNSRQWQLQELEDAGEGSWSSGAPHCCSVSSSEADDPVPTGVCRSVSSTLPPATLSWYIDPPDCHLAWLLHLSGTEIYDLSLGVDFSFFSISASEHKTRMPFK